MSESAAPRMGPIQPGDVLFDLTSSDLASNLKGWQPAFPDARGWTVASASVGGKTLLTIRQNNQVVRTIELAATQLVTSLALLPPQRHIDFPLLALALLDQGRPRLLLYNGQSGEPIRQLNGHADAIRALAFSADGRFLASASEDQTVSVWGLLNRDRILGQRGLLPGVAVKEDNGRVVVTRVFDDSPAHGKLQPGEVIQGVVEGNEVRPLASLLAYYEAVALHKPGSTITLRVEADRKTRDMALVVSQGVDERKPLYSLFLTRSGRGGERHWIGWSPIGPYDSSGPQAERYLAWHFNTGQPGEPTRCALADQYRKEYHREGLLTLLNETGNLSDALAAWEADRRRQPLPPPTLTVWLAELGPGAPVDGQGHLLVRQPRQALQLAIDDFPAEGVASVEYRLDQGPRQPLPRVGGEYRADLPELKPGVHRAQVIVRTNEVEPKEYAAELTVRYQPPPPVIVAQVPPWQVVNDATFTFKAEVQPARPGLEVQVRLSQRHQGKELLTADQQLTGLRIDRTLRLPPGDSVIEVVAVNKDALASHEEWETRRLSIVVHRPEPVPAPRVVLERVVPARGAAPAVEPGRPVVVAERRVRIVGRLEATQELTQAGWARGERGPVQPLTRFEPGKHKTWAIDEQLTLEPGRQIVRVVARTALSPEAEGRLVVEYRPPLPEAIVLGPANGLTLYEGRDPGVVELVARLVRAADPQPFSAVVVLNDKPLAQVPSIDEEAGVLRAKVPLQPGDNRLQLQLENEWHGLATTAAVTVRYLRPPRRLAWERPQPGDKPLVDLTARAESPLPLAPERVRLEVNGQPVKAAAEVTPSGKDPTLWTIQVRRVPLAAGDNRLSLWVGNGDGWSLEPATLTVAYQPPKPPAPPEVTLLEPASDQAVTEARQRVRFRVRSASPLREVVLVRHADGSPPQVRPIDVAALKPLAGGRFELLSHTELDLRPGINRLHVEARNDDGPTSTAPVTITYAPLPVRLVIDRITVPGGITLQPTAQADGLLAFPPAPSGRVLVHGRVLWDRPDDEKLKGVHMVRVYVNGFQQVPVSLLSTSANRERAFQAEILLNRLTSNLVEVELPELAQDTGNRRRCTLDCLKPVTGQRLHLLIVAIGEADEEKLTDQVLRAMQAGRDAKGRLRTPVFDEVVLYGPLVGYVTRGQVGLQIHKMKQALDRRAAAGSANDVILLYFQGGEAAQARHVFLRTSASQFDPDLQRSGIRGTDLINRLGDALGAQVLLLDVLRAGPTDTPSPEQPARWQDPGRVALFRYAYLGISPRSGSVPGLLDDFAEGMRHAERLGDVAAHISQHFRLVSEGLAWVSKRSPKLVADLYVPGSLMDMPISGKRTSP
ncbi:MAG: hypothetical protein NZ700_17740 [Gemmataceae bacterium]|nr:hypothetical protein [Gemmataceae bacterium]MDW8267429.1 WD40 repeat domain-containing protein [Gemmataceae bacterium]